jgi:DNA-binding NtrC family response regulator
MVITDARLGRMSGYEFLTQSCKRWPHIPFLMITAYATPKLAVEAIKAGAIDYLAKPFAPEELLHAVSRCEERHRLIRENATLRATATEVYKLEHIVGESPRILELRQLIQSVAPTDATVLILGESGTGKELIAGALHSLSLRHSKNYIRINCAAIPENLLESELFGHEKGAFTGAHEKRIGRFEQAQGGTLFLDEIGEIDATLQVKLLRFLGERTFERVGSNKTLTADVRLVAATNRDLQAAVKAGEFREDLYFRLRVVEINLPPLRQRPEDIPLLANAFLREYAAENNKNVNAFTPDCLETLMNYTWPGNARELRTAVEHAVVLSRGDRIGVRDLPATMRVAAGSGPVRLLSQPDLTVAEAEKQLIVRALKEGEGNRTVAAAKLGMSRRTLHRKLHHYHLEGF